MKTSRCVLGSLLAASLGLSVALAQNAPATGGGGGGGGGRGAAGAGGRGGGGGFMARASQNPYDEMVKTITSLTDDQKAQLKTKTDALQQVIDNQQTDLRDKMLAVRTAMNDADALVAAATDLQKVEHTQADAIAKSEMDVESVLTADQKVQWEAHKLSQDVDARLRTALLTPDQKTKVDAAVQDTAKALAAVTDYKDKPALIGKFWKKLLAEILTDEQATALMTPPVMPGGMMGMLGMGGGGFGGGMGGGGFGGGMGGGGGGRGGMGGGGGGGRGGMGGGGGGGGRGGMGGGGGGGGRGGMGGGGGGMGGGGGGGGRRGGNGGNGGNGVNGGGNGGGN